MEWSAPPTKSTSHITNANSNFWKKRASSKLIKVGRKNIPLHSRPQKVAYFYEKCTEIRIRRKMKWVILPLLVLKKHFLNFGMVFWTAVKLWKLRKGHCSPPMVGEDNSMVFASQSVPFPVTLDLRSLMAGKDTSWDTKTISFTSHQYSNTHYQP